MLKYFYKRELNDKYLGNLTGISWVFIQPIITLTIYWFVFDKIFGVRIPNTQNISFIVYLALGFWPWLAFSESVIRSITAVSDKSDLIGKIKIDFKIPVLASITATFSLHVIGYIVVLIGLVLFGELLNYKAIPLLLYPLLQMYILAIAIGYILSATQIFVRDTLMFMTTVITLWFFMTPIIYSESILPDNYRNIIQLNPIYTPISFIHKLIVTNEPLPWSEMFVLSLLILLLLYVSIKMFNKLAPHFEDFK